MALPVKPEKADLLRSAFEKMQNKEDLLSILNEVAHIQACSYEPFFSNVERVSLAEIRENPDLTIKELFSLKRKFRITQKQLDLFSSSFKGKEKKRRRYTQFYILKKSGKKREIKAPVPKLKEIQRALNNTLQLVYTVQEQAFGFVPGKNIADNARVHAGASFILNVDIKDFFPSVHFRRIKEMFEKPPFNLTGEREPLAFIIANLCTEDGVLPQGAPTSPLLTNIICQRLDRRLQKLASQFKGSYTRYADDMTFSCNDYVFTKRFMQRLEKILKDERFELNPEKTRIQGKAYRQEVTGLTVNEKVNISRRFYRSYRTLLHLYLTKGPEKALEYHERRMPKSIAVIKRKKVIKDPTAYIKNVILGKYYFISMVKGKDWVPTPFNKDTERKVQSGQFSTLINRSIILPTKEEKDQIANSVNEYNNIQFQTEINESPETYSYTRDSKIEPNKLIENILATWEKESESLGFEQAMELLKNQLNEQ